LRIRNTAEDNIEDEVLRFKTERKQKKEEDEEVQEAIKKAQAIKDSIPNHNNDDESLFNSDDDEDEAGSSSSTPASGRGRGRGRGSTSTRGRGRGKAAAAKDEDDDVDFSGDTAPKRGLGGRGSRRGRSKAPVVVDAGSRSVKDMFAVTNQRQASQRKSTKNTSYT
jgi:hypothetical protein